MGVPLVRVTAGTVRRFPGYRKAPPPGSAILRLPLDSSTLPARYPPRNRPRGAPLTYDTFLICLNRGGDEVVRAAKELWPENGHAHITGEAISGTPEGTAQIIAVAIERVNGPTLSVNVYEKLKERIGQDFSSIIVPLGGAIYGWNRRVLWEWLGKVTP